MLMGKQSQLSVSILFMRNYLVFSETLSSFWKSFLDLESLSSHVSGGTLLSFKGSYLKFWRKLSESLCDNIMKLQREFFKPLEKLFSVCWRNLLRLLGKLSQTFLSLWEVFFMQLGEHSQLCISIFPKRNYFVFIRNLSKVSGAAALIFFFW